MEPPASTQQAEFSLSRDGNSMGCLLDGSVYWWTKARGFRFMDQGVPTSGGVGIAADGSSIIAARATETGGRPTIWFRDGSSTDLGYLSADCNLDHRYDGGFDLNADGTVAVGQTASCDAEIAFVWSPSQGLRELPAPIGTDSRGKAVSADGNMVAGFCEHPDQDYLRPALWKGHEGPILFLGSETAGEAHNVSSNGRYVVGQASLGAPSPQAFLWREESTPVTLGNLSGRATDSSLARAVADDGTVVGWSGDAMWGDQEAFIWTRNTGMVSLASHLADRKVDIPEGMVLTAALDISADGTTIVGLCRDKDWNQGFWRVQLGESPESSSTVQGNPWEPKPMDPVRPDSLDIMPADLLNPFPFGRRRF